MPASPRFSSISVDPGHIAMPAAVAVSAAAPPKLLGLLGGLLELAEFPLMQSLPFVSERLYLCTARV